MSEEKYWCKIIETSEHGQVLIQKCDGEDNNLAIKITFQCEICEVSSLMGLRDHIDECGQHKEFLRIIEGINDASISQMKEEMGLK